MLGKLMQSVSLNLNFEKPEVLCMKLRIVFTSYMFLN